MDGHARSSEDCHHCGCKITAFGLPGISCFLDRLAKDHCGCCHVSIGGRRGRRRHDDVGVGISIAPNHVFRGLRCADGETILRARGPRDAIGELVVGTRRADPDAESAQCAQGFIDKSWHVFSMLLPVHRREVDGCDVVLLVIVDDPSQPIGNRAGFILANVDHRHAPYMCDEVVVCKAALVLVVQRGRKPDTRTMVAGRHVRRIAVVIDAVPCSDYLTAPRE